MYREQKERVNAGSNLYASSVRFINGIKAVLHNRKATIIFLIYMLISGSTIYLHGASVGPYTDTSVFSSYFLTHTSLLVCFIGGAFLLLLFLGAPIITWSISNQFRRIKLENSAGEVPYLIRKERVPNQKYFIYEFIVMGIPVQSWEDKRVEIESALNIHVINIKQGKNRRRILLYAVPYEHALPECIAWDNKYIPHEESLLAIGENLMGTSETIDISKTPHLLIGGSTGSGKTILLKSLLAQCINKKYAVTIADFKGGVDFPNNWNISAEVITEEDILLNELNLMTEIIEFRKTVFRKYGVSNITEYNSLFPQDTMPRRVFACDEIAELLDKTGATKEHKEMITKIESKLSTIARQGRAFGCHLFLATQRPSADTINGQIRNNLDYRICGRADDVLSKIVLDDTSASELIPKDAVGLFLTNTGSLIRGYYFSDEYVK